MVNLLTYMYVSSFHLKKKKRPMIVTWQSCTHWRKFILRGRLSCTQWRKTLWVPDGCAWTDKISCALFPISSFSTRCGLVRTEESDSYVHCVNVLCQNADCYVNRHGVDSLIGAHGNSHLSVLQNKCTSVAGILFKHLKACITLYCTPGRPSVLLQFLMCATPPTVSIGIRSIWNWPQSYPVVLAPGHFYTQSVRQFLVVSTYILVNSTTIFFFLQQMVVSTPFIFRVIFLVPNIEQKIFTVYSEKYLFAEVYVYFFCSTIADTLSSWYIQRWNCICGYW